MFKYIIFFAVTVCSLHCSFASSIAKRDVQPESVSNDIQQITQEVFKEIESSGITAAKYIEWIVNSTQYLTKNLTYNIQTNLLTYLFSAILRLEIFSIADGNRFLSVTDNKLDKEHQVLSVTFSEMFLNLEYMEKMNEIIENTSDAIASEVFLYHLYPEDNVMSYFFNKATTVIKSDSELQKKFTQLKGDVELRTLPRLGNFNASTKGETINSALKLFSGKTFRSLLLTRKFVQHGAKDISMIFNEDVFNRYTLVRSIFKLSSDSKSKLERLQNAYDQSLTKTVEEWDIYDLDFIVNKKIFTTLTEVLEKEPTLNAEIIELQKDFAKSTHFDKDVLKIHLLPF